MNKKNLNIWYSTTITMTVEIVVLVLIQGVEQ